MRWNTKKYRANCIIAKYFCRGSTDFITIATQRPETIMGDTAVCKPDDERYAHLKGKSGLYPP